jgi:hypothetical protein
MNPLKNTEVDILAIRIKEVETEISFHINRLQTLLHEDFGIALFIFQNDDQRVAHLCSTRSEEVVKEAMRKFIKREKRLRG